MRCFVLGTLTIVLMAGTAASAGAASWSLGTHVGMAWIFGDKPGGGSSSALAWPSSPFTYQPALRIGLGDSLHTREVILDSGAFVLNEAGSTVSLVVASLGYQRTFAATASLSPFANLSLGIYREGGTGSSSTKPCIGAGVGLRHVVANGNGVLRAEVRADLLQHDSNINRPGLTTVGLRLGFDLWL